MWTQMYYFRLSTIPCVDVFDESVGSPSQILLFIQMCNLTATSSPQPYVSPEENETYGRGNEVDLTIKHGFFSQCSNFHSFGWKQKWSYENRDISTTWEIPQKYKLFFLFYLKFTTHVVVKSLALLFQIPLKCFLKHVRFFLFLFLFLHKLIFLTTSSDMKFISYLKYQKNKSWLHNRCSSYTLEPHFLKITLNGATQSVTFLNIIL